MKRTNSLTEGARKEDLDRMCEELGADTIKKLHKAYELTAAALYRRAKQRAEAEMLMADQYRTAEPTADKQLSWNSFPAAAARRRRHVARIWH